MHISTDVGIIVDHKDRRFGRIIQVFRFILAEQAVHPVRSRLLHRSSHHIGSLFTSPHRQIDSKDSSQPFVTLHTNTSAMYLDKCFHQCQPDAGTGMMPVDFIEPIENAANVFSRNQAAGIGHRETEERHTVLLQSRKTDSDLSILRSEFKGICQQIEVNAFQLLRICLCVIIRIGHTVEREVDMFPPGSRLKRIIPLYKALQQVERNRCKLHFPGLVSAKIKYLIDQTQ